MIRLKHYIQETEDSEGDPPNMPKGTRITYGPDRDPTKQGTVLVQKLHADGWRDTFFGNVIVEMDDGRVFECNGWQCKKIE